MPEHAHAPANAIGSAGPNRRKGPALFRRASTRARCAESGYSVCHVASRRRPMAWLERLALDDGRSAVSSSSSVMSVSQSASRNAGHACQTAGPSIRPSVSSRQTSIHARRSFAVATSPEAVADSSPSEYANAPIGNAESQRCSRRQSSLPGSEFPPSDLPTFLDLLRPFDLHRPFGLPASGLPAFGLRQPSRLRLHRLPAFPPPSACLPAFLPFISQC